MTARHAQRRPSPSLPSVGDGCRIHGADDELTITSRTPAWVRLTALNGRVLSVRPEDIYAIRKVIQP